MMMTMMMMMMTMLRERFKPTFLCL